MRKKKIRTNFGQFIDEICERHGITITQREISKWLGTTSSRVSRLVMNRVVDPEVNEHPGILKVTDVDLIEQNIKKRFPEVEFETADIWRTLT